MKNLIKSILCAALSLFGMRCPAQTIVTTGTSVYDFYYSPTMIKLFEGWIPPRKPMYFKGIEYTIAIKHGADLYKEAPEYPRDAYLVGTGTWSNVTHDPRMGKWKELDKAVTATRLDFDSARQLLIPVTTTFSMFNEKFENRFSVVADSNGYTIYIWWNDSTLLNSDEVIRFISMLRGCVAVRRMDTDTKVECTCYLNQLDAATAIFDHYQSRFR